MQGKHCVLVWGRPIGDCSKGK